AARGLLDASEDASELLVRQLVGGRQLHVEDALLGGDERVELVGHLVDLGGTPFLGEQLQEVDDGGLGAFAAPREHVLLHPRVDLGVLEQQAQLVDRVDGVAQLRELRLHLLEVALVLRRLEERTRIDAVRNRYDRLPSSWLKSISARASSI